VRVWCAIAGRHLRGLAGKFAGNSDDRNDVCFAPIYSRKKDKTLNPEKGIKAMNDNVNELDVIEPLEIDATELASITAGMMVRSGIRAGLQPCI